MTRIHTIRARQADAGFVGDGAIVCEPMLPNSLEDDSTFLWKSRGIPAGFGADSYDLTSRTDTGLWRRRIQPSLWTMKAV